MGQITQSIIYQSPGENGQLRSIQHELGDLQDSELMIKVSAAGLNRADLLQRQGIYKVPAGETEVPGVEIVGVVVARGLAAKNINLGSRVCGVVSGGGFSEYCALDSRMAINVPKIWSDIEGAAFPEAALTANQALIHLGEVKSGDQVVIHAASSGVGTMLVTMGKALGAKIICTTTSQNKVQPLYDIGADIVIAGKGVDFAESVLEITEGRGADVVIDFLAGHYFNNNVLALKAGGRLVMAGILDDHQSHVNWIPLINKRISVHPLSLRMKPLSEKRLVTSNFLNRWWDGCAYGRLRPIIHAQFSVSDLDVALKQMLKNQHVGKIVITMQKECNF